MKERLIAALLLVTLTTTFAVTQVTPLAAAKDKDNASVALPFSAPATVNGMPAVVTGTFNVTRFVARDGKLLAVGTIIATVPDGAGVRSIITAATLPVDTTASGSPSAVTASSLAAAAPADVSALAVCGILHLVLGPLDLNLLGLVVHLDRVVLDISAAPGPGNLLGNLLCAVAALLDGGLPIANLLNQIANLLNQILAAL
jgi:hypothetical protein